MSRPRGLPSFAYVPSSNATVVRRLLNAGAHALGKTNLDQFACGLNGTHTPHGPVPNAFDPSYISGGSSSGAAFVVASGEVDFALGTDTAGSGRVPAGLNNIVGLKPSRGLISACESRRAERGLRVRRRQVRDRGVADAVSAKQAVAARHGTMRLEANGPQEFGNGHSWPRMKIARA